MKTDDIEPAWQDSAAWHVQQQNKLQNMLLSDWLNRGKEAKRYNLTWEISHSGKIEFMLF